MYKDYRYINAGQNEFYRWGHKAVDLIKSYMQPNENGFYSIPADGGKYYTFGTSEGKYGEFAKHGNTFFSVNKGGYIWAKVGTEKADAFIQMLTEMVEAMEAKHREAAEDEE